MKIEEEKIKELEILTDEIIEELQKLTTNELLERRSFFIFLSNSCDFILANRPINF